MQICDDAANNLVLCGTWYSCQYHKITEFAYIENTAKIKNPVIRRWYINR